MANASYLHWLQTEVTLDNTQEFVEDMNTFYTRYNVLDFSDKPTEELEVLLSLENDRVDVTETEVRNDRVDVTETGVRNDRVDVTETEVRTVLKGASSRKATGPDGISNKILNMCSDQLAGIFARLFQFSLNTHSISML